MMPFVPSVETFFCLALCGSIRDGVVPLPILTDFLLYHLNLIDPRLYTSFYEMEPTNDVNEFLAGIAQKTGKLLKGGKVDEMGAARDVISRFRRGTMGQWPVDLVTPQAFDVRIKEEVRARQREFKGGRNSLSAKMEKDSTYLSQKSGKPTGIMTRAIEKGRNDARKRLGKSGKRKMFKKTVAGNGFSKTKGRDQLKQERSKYKKGKR